MKGFVRVGLRIVLLTLVAVSLLLLAPASFAQDGAVIAVDPAAHDFGNVVEQVQMVSELFEVRNAGASDLLIQKMSIEGVDTSDFWLGLAEWPLTLAPGENTSVLVTFGPSSRGPKSAALRIESNAQNAGTMDVPLTGNGLGLEVLGQVTAAPVLNNPTPKPGQFITIPISVNMNGANPPAHLLQSYQATLTWDPAVLMYLGFALGDSPWRFPASINQGSVANGSVEWFDTEFNGVGGEFAVIRFRFRVVGNIGSGTGLDLNFSRMEGTEVEDLLPILKVDSPSLQVGGSIAVAPDIAVAPTSHDYGAVPLGSSAAQPFTVSNTGSGNLSVQSIRLMGANANQFAIDSGGAPFTLAADQSQEVVVSFNPTTEGAKSAVLLIRSNDPDEAFFFITLLGSASAPDITVEPASLDFGDVAVGAVAAQALTITNEGTAPLQLTQFGLDGHLNQFAYDSGTLAILAPGASGQITVFFNPTSAGVKNATFVIHSNDPDETSVTVPLTGNGISD